MKIYNDSGKEYTLPDGKGGSIPLGIKKTVEVDDKLGKKLLGIKAYRGLKDAENLIPGKKSKLEKDLEATRKDNKRQAAEIKELKKELADLKKGSSEKPKGSK